jgi:DNA topoisomerase-1
VRDEAKYHDILVFGESLPKLRAAVERDLASAQLTKQKVVATVLRIMERTSFRVGNDKYLEENGSHGLTTLLDRHATISGGLVTFQFRGKGGKPYRAALRDRRLAAIVKRCRDIPGQRLFQYADGNRYRPITSTDVNEYIQEAMGSPFTAKAFRTWSATVAALVILYRCNPCRSVTAGKRTISKAVDEVAGRLGNTRAICRKSYIHPAVFDSYLRGELHERFSECLARARGKNGLSREECALLAYFEQLAPAAASSRALRAA